LQITYKHHVHFKAHYVLVKVAGEAECGVDIAQDLIRPRGILKVRAGDFYAIVGGSLVNAAQVRVHGGDVVEDGLLLESYVRMDYLLLIVQMIPFLTERLMKLLKTKNI
jgi:hypothetical protein